ncbi:uncharacterized protein BDZ99DRAFT_389709 [Mytilinidion resinicola]|uniref:Uncharacterized protein n=1 Tax=Mytilinidion resinicola TaxID=574789 RepID=A0A6A6YK36_9PEZI|nr:uncharacterized protein BDZ99DRAFT_389709 [Mytilinidion resinicola]KAF2809236.1 hypothetical protein BDZ99DRAFT_389709 [Mytilinidion resinicola]
MASDPAPHSKPVVIPPRTPTRSSISTQTVRARGQNGGRRQQIPNDHRPNAIPPAVAALLAVTAIPPRPTRRRKNPTSDRRISIDELIQEWRQEDVGSGSSSVNSYLDLLLEQPDEREEDEPGSLGSPEQDKDFMSSRSVSSESIPSVPSLEGDEQSVASSWNSAATPNFSVRKPGAERKEKYIQSPPTEECVLDHPLLHFSSDEYEETDITTTSVSPESQPSTLRFKTFKSNLTASLQALKSAAKSFSNFTAPSVPPDDLLTRSLLSPRFTSEMRPKPLQGLPTPALRRYLNPQPTSISPTELSMQFHDGLDTYDADSLPPMIQMQTYDRRSRSSSRKRRGSTGSLPEERTPLPTPAVRQREPRENGDFLRVIVLEMNMRRGGKLDAKAAGRARVWLPPRKTNGRADAVDADGGVPARWVGMLAEEL